MGVIVGLSYQTKARVLAPGAPVVHASAHIEAGAEIGEGCEIGPRVQIGANVRLGRNVRIDHNVILRGHTIIDDDVEICTDCIIGGGVEGEGSMLSVGPRTVLREQVTLAGGTPETGGTMIGGNCFFMVSCDVAPDTAIGDSCVFANAAMIGAGCQIDASVWAGGVVIVEPGVRIGAHAFLGLGAEIVADVIPYGSVYGRPAFLAGLNLIGMKRRGFARCAINDVRAAYRMLFANEGGFSERLAYCREMFDGSAEVSRMLSFISADREIALCKPRPVAPL